MNSGKECTLSSVRAVSIECGDCGRLRWRKPSELYRFGITPATQLSQLGSRLACSACRNEGQHGKNVVIQAMFITESERAKAEAYMLNNRAARATG